MDRVDSIDRVDRVDSVDSVDSVDTGGRDPNPYTLLKDSWP